MLTRTLRLVALFVGSFLTHEALSLPAAMTAGIFPAAATAASFAGLPVEAAEWIAVGMITVLASLYAASAGCFTIAAYRGTRGPSLAAFRLATAAGLVSLCVLILSNIPLVAAGGVGGAGSAMLGAFLTLPDVQRWLMVECVMHILGHVFRNRKP